jgi:hypothetical protein
MKATSTRNRLMAKSMRSRPQRSPFMQLEGRSARPSKGYVFPAGRTPPTDPPPGLRLVRRELEDLDDNTRQELEMPAFLRRRPHSSVPGSVQEKPPAPGPEEEYSNKALIAFLAELDTTGGSVLSRALLEKHGIIIDTDANPFFNLQQAFRQLDVLMTAFQEATEYDPIRHRLHFGLGKPTTLRT